MPGNAAFHPTIETVGFQTAFSVICFVMYIIKKTTGCPMVYRVPVIYV
jgi:hypothetical protein